MAATLDSVIQVSWAGKLYKSGLGQVCAVCGDKNVAMLRVRGGGGCSRRSSQN